MEIMIGLSLATLLFSSLFSAYRHLLQTEEFIAKQKESHHWETVLTLRLNQVFASIPSHSLFTIEPYGDLIPEALHFTFYHGVDPDPYYCQTVEGFLGLDESKALCLYIEPKVGPSRKEVFAEKATYQLSFLDPRNGQWVDKWETNFLPPLVKLSIRGKEFFFHLPNTSYEVCFS